MKRIFLVLLFAGSTLEAQVVPGSPFGSVPGATFSSRIRLSSNYTNATTTFSNTALSGNVISGRKYGFLIQLFISNTIAVDGVALDFNGGAATITSFVAHCELVSNAGAATVQTNATSVALATVINAPTLGSTSVHWYSCAGEILPSSSDTFIVRARLNTITTGVLTIKTGSSLWLEDIP